MRPLVTSLGCVVLSLACPAQVVWTQIKPSTSPGIRAGHVTAYDSARSRIVLFGGANGQKILSDTWEWDGKNWVQMKPTNSPRPQPQTLAMAYDSARQRTVLYLGGDYYRAYATFGPETWEWDGKNWTQIKPTTSPLNRRDTAMVYDAARKRVVLFGGYYISLARRGNAGLADTWEWDGKNWKASLVTSPSPRSGHAMAYDALRQRTVLFGGGDPYYFSPTPTTDETWEWDGKAWTQIKPRTSPGKLAGHEMAYDSARKRIVLFGGGSARWLVDTWEWDGVNWTQIKSTTSPSVRRAHAMAYDSARQRTVLFGGFDSSKANLGDTWEYTGPVPPLTADSYTVSIGTGGLQNLSLNAGSQHGKRLYWIFGSLSGATPGVTLGSAIGPVHIPLNPDVWTDYSIALSNTPTLVGTKATLDASGTAKALFRVPKANVPRAIGLVFHHAYLVYDASNNFYMASNAVPLRLVK